MDPFLIVVLIVIGLMMVSLVVYAIYYFSAKEVEKECLIVEKNTVRIPGGNPKQYYIIVEYDGIRKKMGTYDEIYFSLNVNDLKVLKIKGNIIKSVIK